MGGYYLDDMPALDSLLRIVDQQGANELRLGSDKAPAMFAAGTPKKLAIPATTTETLRDLFGELLDEHRIAQLDRLGRVEFSHDADKIGSFRITVTKRPGGALAFDAIVMRANAKAPDKPNAAASSGPPPQPAVVVPEVPPPLPATDETPRAAAPPSPPAQDRHPYRLAPGLEALVGRAVSLGASDVHLSEHEAPVARAHGRLIPLDEAMSAPLWELAKASFGAFMEAQLASLGSCDLSIDLPQGGRGRVNVYSTSRGLAMAIRLLPRGIPAVGSLGFPVPIEDLAALPNGLVLVTGATGSGKSTTLASLAQHALASRSALVLTLEDPIEYVFEPVPGSLVRQRQIGRDVRDFATGLRDALREDPDVLLIGEMRDAESIQLALTAAETGHLVLASLHSRSAVGAVERIIDIYPPERQAQIRVMLSESLRAVVAQRLLPNSAGAGRVLAAEVLRVTSGVAAAIRDAKPSTIRSSMQSGRGEGMIILERSLVDLVKRRAITVDVARGAANDASMFTQYLGT